nr:hypothetical protein [Tanacetum cinerariifolium]
PIKPTPIQKAGKGKVIKARTVKSSLQLVDEPDKEQDQLKAVPEPQGSVAIHEPIAEATHPLPVVEGKGKAIEIEEQAAQSLLVLYTPRRRSTTDQFIFQRRTPATKEASTGPSTQPQDDTSANIVQDVDNQVYLDERMTKLDEGQTGSDPGKTLESRPPPDDDKMDEDQAGSDHGKSHDDTSANIVRETPYPADAETEDVDNQVYLDEQMTKLDEGQAGSDPGKTLESRPPPDDDKMDEDQAGSDHGKSHGVDGWPLL